MVKIFALLAGFCFFYAINADACVDGAQWAEENDITDVEECSEGPDYTDEFVEACAEWVDENNPEPE